MVIHPRVSLHQVAFAGEPTAVFIEYCRSIGMPNMTLSATRLMQPGEMEAAQEALAAGGTAAHTVIHAFANHPDLESDSGRAADLLLQVLDVTASLGASNIYLVTGSRGSLSWEQAADRFAALLSPCLMAAREKGIRLLVEPASGFNADIHIAHTLDDTITLAQIAGIGVCLDLHPCWFEGGLDRKVARAIPHTGLVQVSDYVFGDRTAPCRAVPGDGMIPLEHLLGQILDRGYQGVFDLELVGPRITQEGARKASRRAAEYLSKCLFRLCG